MRRAARWLGWLAVVAFAIVLTAVAVLAVLIETDWGHRQVIAIAEARFAEVYLGGVSIGDIDLSWRGDVTARDVVVHDADGMPAVMISEVRGRIELPELLHRELRVPHVEATGVMIVIDRRDLTSPGPRSPWSMWLPDVEVHGATIIFAGQHVDAPRVDAVIDVRGGGELFSSFAIGGRWRERGVPVDVAATLARSPEDLNGDLTKRETRVPLMVAQVGGVGVTIAGASLLVSHGTGVVAAAGSREAWAALGVATPVRVAIAAVVGDGEGGFGERARVVGMVDHSPVRGELRFDFATRTAGGELRVAGVDAGELRRGALGTLAGTVAFDVDASRGEPVIAVHAHASGRGVRYAGARADAIALDIDATGPPAHPAGRARLELRGVSRGAVELSSLIVTAASRGGPIDAGVRANGPRGQVSVDARVTLGADATTIDVRRHDVRVDDEDWHGTGGRVTIAKTGAITVRGLSTRSERGELSLDGTYARGRLRVDATGEVTGIGRATAHVDIAGAEVRRADVSADADLGKLAALLGVQRAVTGKVAVRASAQRDAVTATVDATVDGIAGTTTLTADRHGVRATGALANDELSWDATLSTTLAQLVANPRAILGGHLGGTITIPDTDAKRLAQRFDRTDIVGGTFGGTVTLAGTVTAPTATAHIAARDLAVALRAGRAVAPRVDIDATADRHAAHATLVARTSDGGELRITASAPYAHLAAAHLALAARRFELHALTAALPGAAGAIAGRLDGDVTVDGVDPRTARVAGLLRVTGARIPVAPQLGTLRDASVSLAIANDVATVAVDGKLRRGTVRLRGTLPLAGQRGHATIQLRHISPISSIEPTIDADVTADLHRTADRLDVALAVRNGVVRIPDERNHALDPVGLPDDFTMGPAPAAPPPPPPRANAKDAKAKAPPPHPTLVVTVDLGRTRVESGEIHTAIAGKVTLSVGAAQPGGSRLGVVGKISAQRGDAKLFGRRYELDRASAQFDGSTDPIVDAQITYDFADVTTITELRGRLSKPQLAMRSNPPTYSQDELLGFLLGGEPNGDPTQSQSASASVATAGTSLVAAKLSGYFKKALPISIDVLGYESATATNSAALRVGTWLTRDLFLAYRRHLDVRPDENASEGEVEYWLTPRISVEGTAGDRDYDGVDLLWRHRW